MTKKKQITKDTGIIDALEINPNAADILTEAGLGCLGCSMAAFETLEQGLAAHGFGEKEVEDILERLNK
ncbi:MAG: DUF1858 domain-containing protein [Nanoarchaeota archaeon]|nr:DUF1858 domain-containing protein [Nanoarchaeota archaeon]